MSTPRHFPPGHWLSDINRYSDYEISYHAQQANRIIAVERKHSNMVFLDAGCGYGELTRKLVDDIGLPANVHGCDIDPNRIVHCKRLNPAIHYFQHDLLEPLPEDRNFDMIFLTAALAQFDSSQQNRVLEHLRSRLNPTGFLWVLDVQGQSTQPLFDRLISSPDWKILYDKPLAKRLFGRVPVVMLAERYPHSFLRLVAKVLPGDWMLRQMVVKAI